MESDGAFFFVCLLTLLWAQNPRRKVSPLHCERGVPLFLERLKHELGEPWWLESMAEKAGRARTRFTPHCRRLSNLPQVGHLRISGWRKPSFCWLADGTTPGDGVVFHGLEQCAEEQMMEARITYQKTLPARLIEEQSVIEALGGSMPPLPSVWR